MATTIKISHLRTFVAVSACGNIKDAADRLGRTPSAVSMALKQFEDELGGRLFEADRKSALTPLGRFVLTQADDAISHYERLAAGIEAYAKNQLGRLVIACVPSVSAQLLPEIIRAFVAERPQVELEVQDMDSNSVRRALAQGQVDLGLASLQDQEQVFEAHDLFADRFGVVVANGHPLTALERALRWKDLVGETVIANGLSLAIRDSAYRALEEQSKLTVRNVTSLMALVRSGIGVTLLPHLAVPLSDPDLQVLDLSEGPLQRRVALLRRRGETLSPVAQLFFDKLLTDLPGIRASFELEGHARNDGR